MRTSSVIESVRIPVLFTVAMWIIIFGMMVVIEAVEYIDDHLLVAGVLT